MDNSVISQWQKTNLPERMEAVLICAVVWVIYPALATPFFITQIAGYAFILGIICLSLMILGGLGGMVSMAQITIAGMAAYTVAITGDNNLGGLGWHWILSVSMALIVATVLGGIIGAISVRTEGIYTIMITLAIAVSIFFFARQNYAIFNGFTGFSQVTPPIIFGINFNGTYPFYYLTSILAIICYWCVKYAMKSPFGLVLQAIRENPRRVSAMGFYVGVHRVVTHMVSGFIAGIGGILLVWFMGRISPGAIGVDIAIDILVIAVIGGIRHPMGPFIGAIAFVLLENFAIDLIDRERFNMVIGFAFLGIVLFSPNGLLGILQSVYAKIHKTA